MRVPVLLALAALLLGADAREPDPRAAAKALWTEAAQASDVWTCLQLEAWAREQKPAARLPAILGGSALVGSPLLAFPEPVRQLADLGDRLLVCTERRLYTLAPDGRPLRRSLPLHPATPYTAFGFAGRAVAAVRAEHDRKATVQTIEVGSMLVEGKGVLQARWSLVGEQRWTEDLCVADDGSAVALVIRDPSMDGPAARSVTVCAEGRTSSISGMRSAVAVGRKGAWMVGAAGPSLALVRGERRQAIAQAAAGPGMVATFIDGKPVLVLPDGSDRPLDPGQPLGKEPGLATVGTWLVLATGYGGKGVSQGDLLGEGAGKEVELPSTLALWRWADLASEPAAKPAATMTGYLSVSASHPAALLVWEGKAIDLVDLEGREPQRRRFFDAPFPVAWTYTDQQVLVATDRDGNRAVFGPDKAELWSGRGEDLTLRRRDLALYWTPGKEAGERHWHLQHLAAEPARRTTVALALDPVDQDIEVGFRLCDWAVGRHDGEWRRTGLDGKLIDQGSRNGPDPKPRPPCDNLWPPLGRFYFDGARIYGKAAGPPADPARRLLIQDAWRFGQFTTLLDDERDLLVGRRRGDLGEAGRCPEADRFGLANRQAALLTGDARPVALIGSGPSLITRLGDITKVEEMPAGPWRLDESGRFTAPHGRQLVWDGERVGFQPLRLRSPDESGLFVITRSVLIELEADVARLVGREP